MSDTPSKPIRKFPVRVTFLGPGKRVIGQQVVHVRASEPVQLTLAYKDGKTSRELTYRASIKKMSGLQKRVMTDLYRHLVISNYVDCDGRSGHGAETYLDMCYPDQGTLSPFYHKSESFNTTGEIIYNLRRGWTRADYLVLGSILEALIGQGVDEEPRMTGRHDFKE